MERRTFLKWATHGMGAIVGAIVGGPAVLYVLDPRNRPAPEGDFRVVAKLNELRTGVPTQAIIKDTRRDAWTLHPNEVIGRVWLVRREDDKVDAFTTVCPHLGCSINHVQTQEINRFVCPCHNGSFHISGERITDDELGATNPAPRGMDSLEVEYTTPPGGDDVTIGVKYQNFYQGIPEKRAKV